MALPITKIPNNTVDSNSRPRVLEAVVQSPSHVLFFATPWTAAHQTSLSLTISQSLSKFMSIALVMPSSYLILRLPLLLPTMFPSIRDFSSELAVRIRYQNTRASASVFPMTIQGWLPLRLTGLISLLSRESRESSLTPQLEGTGSLAFCLFYGPALTTVHDHWEGHSLDFPDLCWQSDHSVFQHTV